MDDTRIYHYTCGQHGERYLRIHTTFRDVNDIEYTDCGLLIGTACEGWVRPINGFDPHIVPCGNCARAKGGGD